MWISTISNHGVATEDEQACDPFHPTTRRSRAGSTRATCRTCRGACRLLADGVDIRIIQLMLGHASVQQTQRYLNVTDEELRKGLEVSWGRQLRAVSGQ